MKRYNMWPRNEDRAIRRRTGRSDGRNRSRSRNEDPWGRRVVPAGRKFDERHSPRYDDIDSLNDGPLPRSYDDGPPDRYGEWPPNDGPDGERPRGYGRSLEKSRRRDYRQYVYNRPPKDDYIDRPFHNYDDGLHYYQDGSYGGGFVDKAGYGDFLVPEHESISRRDNSRHLDEPPGLKNLEKSGICWDFNSDFGCRRPNCRLRHEFVDSSYAAVGDLPRETPEEKSKRDSEMLQYFQKIDQVTQSQKKVQTSISPPPEINPQQSTILDEPMDVINNEPVINEPVINETVNNDPVLSENVPSSTSYAPPPIPPMYQTEKGSLSRVVTVNPPSKAPKIIRAPANVVTIVAPKTSPERTDEEALKSPPIPPGLAQEKKKTAVAK